MNAGQGDGGLTALSSRAIEELKRRPVHVFVSDARVGSRRSRSWASLAAVSFTNSLDYGYSVIWIDLENHHTVEGIVAEIFAKVRLVDPQAPTCVITDLHADTVTAINKAVARIREVFMRGRYVLVLDSVESFGRPQMMHHGLPTYDLYRILETRASQCKDQREQLLREFQGRVSNLARFVESLLLLKARDAGRNYADHPFLGFVRCRLPRPTQTGDIAITKWTTKDNL